MRSRAVGLLVCVLLVLPTAALPAGPEIFLRDEPEAYVLIDKLQGLGLLPGLMTGTRGLEAREVALEAGKEEQIGDPFVNGMLRFLQLGGARDLDFRIGGGLGYSNAGYIPPNAQGVPVPDGAGYRVNGFFRAAPYNWLGFQARAETVAGSDGERTGRIEETSLRLGWPQATLEELSYDRTERSFPGPAEEQRKRIMGGLVAWLTRNVRAEGKAVYERFSGEGGVPGRDGSTKSIELSAAYQYR
jgi:hypothetical protein